MKNILILIIILSNQIVAAADLELKDLQVEIDPGLAQWVQDLEKKTSSEKQEIIDMPLMPTEKQMQEAKDIVSQTPLPEILQDTETAGTDFFIFASFSLGEHRMKELIKIAMHYNGIVVLRNMKDKDVMKTARFIANHAPEGGLIVDPTLFNEYQVTKVPTYVLVKPCGINCQPTYDRLEGNVSPRYALEKISIEGDLKDDALARLKK